MLDPDEAAALEAIVAFIREACEGSQVVAAIGLAEAARLGREFAAKAKAREADPPPD